MTKIQKTLCLSSLLLLSPLAWGQWEPNFLIGISGGYGHTSGNFDVTMTPTPPITTTSFPKEIDKNRWLWGLLAGYQAKCNRWLVGGEVNVEWMERSKTNNFAFTDALGVGWASAATFERDTTVALTGRLGYALNEFFLPYVRMGIETSHDKIIYQSSSASGLLVTAEQGSRGYRFVGGAGVELPVPNCSNVSFRLEYNYHSPGKAINADAPASDTLTLVATGTKQKVNVGKASLVWNFF